MSLERYKKTFVKSLSIEESNLKDSLEYNEIPEWDSIGHMSLVGKLEDCFNISMEMDDIIDFSSYEYGKRRSVCRTKNIK